MLVESVSISEPLASYWLMMVVAGDGDELLYVFPGVATAELIEPPAGSAFEPIRLRLGGGRELVLPASMSDQRVAALVCLIEDRASIIGGGCDSK